MAYLTILTPEGRGAVGVVRIWGPGAVEVADAVFRPVRGVRLSETPEGRLRLGRVGQGLGDEVVAVVLPGHPPVVEFQCHGGAAPTALVVDALTHAGARSSPARTWLRNEAGSPIQAAALEDLTRASTLRTAEILLEQAQGALDRRLERLIMDIKENPIRALDDLDRLIKAGQVGLRLLSGWRIVITGRPNVGKSRLLNALSGYQRAIVDPTPGTTRDVLTVRTAIAGWPVELADTAGLRPTEDLIELRGIEFTRLEYEAADLVLLVLDRSEPIQPLDRELLSSLVEAIPVANKADLEPVWPLSETVRQPASIISVSAERGDGLDRLIEEIVDRLVPEPPAPGAAVPFRAEHLPALRAAREYLKSGDESRAARLLKELLTADRSELQVGG